MTSRTVVLGTVLGLLNLPVALALTEAVDFFRSNRSTGGFVSGGASRDYLLHVPPRYDPAKPTPLVISLHGAALWGAGQRDISQWDRVADTEGFIVVYPSGVRGSGPRTWRVDDAAGARADVGFIAALIDTLQAHYLIDPRRIYANGLSNGGAMAFVLSCALADRIAAVGMVAAAYMLPWSSCPDRRPVPMIAFHGTADAQVPYEGGSSWVWSRPFPSIPKWTAAWSRRNGCAGEPVDSIVAPDVTRREYRDCADGASVVLYTVDGGGHSWPGGGPLPEWWVGPTNRTIDASSEMWDFFRRHPLVGAARSTPH
jgi:polyhydroxybutyrate depolymerase